MGTYLRVHHRRPMQRRQRGVALLVMVTVISLGATWLLVSALKGAASRSAQNRQDNARVLAEAKQALAGWQIRQAIETGERNPGRLPCPEAPAYIGTANEGIAAGNCTLPAVGRLPWRTLGLPQLRDASGEPLWYVVSAGWALQTVSSTLTINSDSLGQLTLDGSANAAVALVIAPGPALEIPSPPPSGCTARSQSRTALLPDFRDYLECENANADGSFATGGPADYFNDQVLAVTTRDLLPGLEAAIAKRIEREIVPQLKTLYASDDWGAAVTLNNPVFPFPAQFYTSTPPTTFQGVYGSNKGLLPVSYYAASCGVDPACSSTFVSWTTPVVSKISGSGTVDAPFTCGTTAPQWYYCTGYYYGAVNIRMTDKIANVANALRTFDVSTIPSPNGQLLYWNTSLGSWSTVAATLTHGFESSDGSFKYSVEGSLPDPGAPTGQYFFYSWRPSFLNHPLLSATGRVLKFNTGGLSEIKSGATVTGLNSGASGIVVVVKRNGDWATGNAAGDLLFSSVTGTFESGEDLQVGGTTRAIATGTDVDIGWFARNEWYRVLYYAVAPGQTAASSSCSGSGTSCLTLVTDATPNDKRALLLLVGRSLPGQTRPNAALANYLETAENTDPDTTFEQPRINASVNDRVIAVGP